MKNDIIEITLKEAYEKAKGRIGIGKVADYIPELAKNDKNLLGVTILTKEGDYHEIGDSNFKFTIQSVSKPIILIHALEAFGFDKVFSVVGMEPTGDSFNSIVKLETRTEHPLNPFINAGAIAVTGLLNSGGFKFQDTLNLLKKLCGRDDIDYSESVFKSEKETGNVNKSIAYLLKSQNIIEKDVEETLDYYFKMCSILITTKDLARFSMLLANDGIDIITKEQVIDKKIVRVVKTLMVTCGMYEKSGEFAMYVGMPAKSGVGGGIIASAQNRMGIAVFGPSLDEVGNSIGGQVILKHLSNGLKLHYFE